MTEGWGVFTGSVCHYYRDTMSLCKRRGFYLGPLDAETVPMKGECVECRKRLDREKRKVKKP